MISTSTAVIERGGVLRSVRSRPPLTIRQLRAEPAEVCQLCLVGSAAGPLAGDQVSLQLRLEPGARARLTSTGASLAQGNGGFGRLRSCVELAEDAELIAEPAPVIACAGSTVRIELDLRLAATSTVHWRELLVLGRHDEPSGSAVLDWRVDRAGQPVLRQRLELTDPALLRWPGLLAGGRVLATALVSGPQITSRTMVDSPTAVCQLIDPHTALLSVLDTEAASARQRLDLLLERLSQ